MRKIRRLRLGAKNNSGIILLVVLWSLVVVAVLAVTLARGTQMELAMARNAVGKVQSQYIAWAGVMYAIEHIRQDTGSDDEKDFDTLYLCGVPQSAVTSLEAAFGGIAVGDGAFSIVYEEYSSDTKEADIFYGLRDLERYVNLNTISIQTAPILSSLLKVLGADATTAEQVAYSVVDWIDADEVLSHTEYGAESDYYKEADPLYTVKNKPFDSLEELLLVRGVNEEIFMKLRPYVTLFPREGSFKVNFDTAPRAVLLALANSVAGSMTNTELSDAESLVEKMIAHRKGDDQAPGTQDDREMDLNAMSLNIKERTIFLALNGYRTKKSGYFHAQVLAKTEPLGVESAVDAVIQRDDLSIVSWRRQ